MALSGGRVKAVTSAGRVSGAGARTRYGEYRAVPAATGSGTRTRRSACGRRTASAAGGPPGSWAIRVKRRCRTGSSPSLPRFAPPVFLAFSWSWVSGGYIRRRW